MDHTNPELENNNSEKVSFVKSKQFKILLLVMALIIVLIAGLIYWLLLPTKVIAKDFALGDQASLRGLEYRIPKDWTLDEDGSSDTMKSYIYQDKKNDTTAYFEISYLGNNKSQDTPADVEYNTLEYKDNGKIKKDTTEYTASHVSNNTSSVYESAMDDDDRTYTVRDAFDIDGHQYVADIFLVSKDFQSGDKSKELKISKADKECMQKIFGAINKENNFNEDACINGDHQWNKATCTEPMYCSECGDIQGKALGHKWGKWKTTKASITTDGGKMRTCSRCGKADKDITVEHPSKSEIKEKAKTQAQTVVVLLAAADSKYQLHAEHDAWKTEIDSISAATNTAVVLVGVSGKMSGYDVNEVYRVDVKFNPDSGKLSADAKSTVWTSNGQTVVAEPNLTIDN